MTSLIDLEATNFETLRAAVHDIRAAAKTLNPKDHNNFIGWRVSGVVRVARWLWAMPGDTWQQKWVAADGDCTWRASCNEVKPGATRSMAPCASHTTMASPAPATSWLRSTFECTRGLRLSRTRRWCAQFASHSAGCSACVGDSGTCGTTWARSLALGASTP